MACLMMWITIYVLTTAGIYHAYGRSSMHAAKVHVCMDHTSVKSRRDIVGDI